MCAQVAAEQEAWKAAMARARGERVLDDPKLLSRSAHTSMLVSCVLIFD